MFTYLLFNLVQLEELLEPYLKDTDLGLPYWDWTKNITIPDLWEDVYSPVKDYNHPDFGTYNLSVCQNKFPGKQHLICKSPHTVFIQ